MRFEFDPSSKKNLNKLAEQGNDINNIPVRVISFKLVNGELQAILEPGIYPKDDYQLRAKKDCSCCRGYGYIRYCLDQDDIKSAPCHICFPETASRSEWMRRAME